MDNISTFWWFVISLLGIRALGLIVEPIRNKRALAKQALTAAAAVPMVPTPAPVVVQPAARSGSLPDRMAVRDILDGGATVVIRERSRRKVVTAHMIIWAGNKRTRIEDSYYDLGIVSGEYGDQAVAELTKTALDKMLELTGRGASKVVAVPADEASAAPAVAPPDETSKPAGTATVSVEDNQPADHAIKMKKFPSIFRGEILEVGYMPRAIDGVEKPCFGVRYVTPEGVEDVVWGVNLKTALREAKAGVGDSVEILKIGRKTMEEGRAPMNLYKASKIPA